MKILIFYIRCYSIVDKKTRFFYLKVRLILSFRYCFEGSASLSMPPSVLLPCMLP